MSDNVSSLPKYQVEHSWIDRPGPPGQCNET